MQTIVPKGEIIRIEDTRAIIKFADGEIEAEVSKLPKGAKVGDLVTVFLQTTVEIVKPWPPK